MDTQKERKITIRISPIIKDNEDGQLERFALRVGVSLVTARSWMTKTTRPRMAQLEKILNAYPDLELNDLIEVVEIEPEAKESTLA